MTMNSKTIFFVERIISDEIFYTYKFPYTKKKKIFKSISLRISSESIFEFTFSNHSFLTIVNHLIDFLSLYLGFMKKKKMKKFTEGRL